MAITPPLLSSTAILNAPIVTPVIANVPMYETDIAAARIALQAWNLLTKIGLTDLVVRNAATVETIETFTETLPLHDEMKRPLSRARLALRRSEQLGILTDMQMALALTMDDVHDYLTSLVGYDDGDLYSSTLQGD